MLTPRPYQDQSVKAAFKYMRENARDPGNPLIAWPTGTGKAFGIALFVKQLFEKYPTSRVIITVPSEELCEQNYEEIKDYWPSAPIGVYCASLKRYDVGYPITIGTIDSIDGNVNKFGKIDIMIPDECHRISAKEDSRYKRVYDHFKARNKYFFMLGWTATDYRMGQGKLTDAGGLFTEVIYDATTLKAFNWFFEQAYLVPPISAPTRSKVSGERMAMVGGDFKQSDLQEAFERDREAGVIEQALRESIAVAQEDGRKHWICFVPGKDACEEVAEMLDSMGVSATYVHSGLKRAERRQRLKDYKKGLYTCMVNNGILTTGFNFKALDFMIMLRKTASASLWVQMLGRGTRPFYAEGFDLSTFEGRWAAIRANGKFNFRVMDFVGNTERLGPINDPVKPKKPGDKKSSGAPIKLCPVDPDKPDENGKVGCGSHNHPSVRECFYCDYVFPLAPTVEAVASTAPLVAETVKPEGPITEWFNIDNITYQANFMTKKPSLVVTYYCGKKKYKEYVCLQHSGYASKKARDWWRARSDVEPPTKITDALQHLESLKWPTRVLVWTNAKPVEIKNYDFGKASETTVH